MLLQIKIDGNGFHVWISANIPLKGIFILKFKQLDYCTTVFIFLQLP